MGAIAFILSTAILLQDDSAPPVRRLIEQLRSEKADVREDARRRLKELGRKAAPELEKAAQGQDPEVVASVQHLLRALAIADRLPPRLLKGVPGIEYRLAADKHAWTTVFLELWENRPESVELEDIEPLAPTALREAADGEERIRVIDRVHWQRFRNTVPELLKLLEDRETLQHAAWALAEMQVRSAIPPLIRLLESTDEDVLTCAITCLEQMEARGAIPGIRKLLLHEDSLVQAKAAGALGWMGDKESAPQLMKLLGSDVPYVRERAVRGLGMLREEAALPEIVPLLKHDDPRLRGAAAMALGRLQAQRFAPELLACLKDEDPGVRASACLSLADLQVDAAIPALIDLLQGQPLQVRQAALGGLELLKAAAAIPRVVPLLREQDLNVRHSAARFLCALGSREAVSTVLQGRGDSIRLFVLNQLRSPRRTKALGGRPLSMNFEGTVPDLIQRLRDASPERVELPTLDFAQGPGQVLLLQCDGSPTVLGAWEELVRHFPDPCDVVVDEDRIRILPREQALAFWKEWHRATK